MYRQVNKEKMMLRLGLCSETAKVDSLLAEIGWCADHGIGCFCFDGNLFGKLDLTDEVKKGIQDCKDLAQGKKVRLVLHLDDFVGLNAPDSKAVDDSIKKLEYQGVIAELFAADVIKIKGGYVYDDKNGAVQRLSDNLKRLSKRVLSRLALQNDEKYFGPRDLIPICLKNCISFVYGVQHYRDFKDGGLGIEESTMDAIETWDREPLLHISCPKGEWDNLKPGKDDDYVHIDDFPASRRSLGDVTLEVDSKELAITRLRDELQAEGVSLWPG